MPNRKFARSLRRNQTDAENRLWYFLRAHRFSGFKFRRQHPIGPYIVDFACPAEKLVVELDGGQHADAGYDDEARDKWLEQRGYRVLRFWNNDVLAETQAVLQSILTALEGQV